MRTDCQEHHLFQVFWRSSDKCRGTVPSWSLPSHLELHRALSGLLNHARGRCLGWEETRAMDQALRRPSSAYPLLLRLAQRYLWVPQGPGPSCCGLVRAFFFSHHCLCPSLFLCKRHSPHHYQVHWRLSKLVILFHTLREINSMKNNHHSDLGLIAALPVQTLHRTTGNIYP